MATIQENIAFQERMKTDAHLQVFQNKDSPKHLLKYFPESGSWKLWYFVIQSCCIPGQEHDHRAPHKMGAR